MIWVMPGADKRQGFLHDKSIKISARDIERIAVRRGIISRQGRRVKRSRTGMMQGDEFLCNKIRTEGRKGNGEQESNGQTHERIRIFV